MENNKTLTLRERKAQERFKTVEMSLEVLGLFWELEFKSLSAIYLQLCMAFPKYATAEGKSKLSLMWNCVQYDTELINDLFRTIDKINEQ